MAVKLLPFAVFWLLAGCAGSNAGSASAAPVDVNLETRMAVYSQAATIAAADSQDAMATYYAVSAESTRVAGITLTATAAAQQATADALFATSQAVAAHSTQAAVSVLSTRAAADSRATEVGYNNMATAQAAAVAGTMAAISHLAQLEQGQAALHVTRQALENQRLQNEVQRGKLLPWALLVLGVAAVAGIFAIVWRRSNPVTVIEPPVYGGWIPVVRDGYTALGYGGNGAVVPASVPLLPASTQTAEIAPNSELPAIVELPDVPRGGDTLMIGVSPNRALSAPYYDLMDMMGAGAKGSGKSTTARMLAYQSRLMGWRTYLADAEGLTFAPGVWGDVAMEPEAFGQVVEAILDEFSRRAALFAQAFTLVREMPADQQDFVESLRQYNAFAPRLGLQPLPVMALWVDEANQFMGRDQRADKRLETLLQLNRKNGCVVGVFAHSWHGDGVPSFLYRRFTYRLALACDERTSRVVIGSPAAATLPLRSGLAIVRQTGRAPFKIKSYYLAAPRVLRDIHPVDGEWVLPASAPPTPTITDAEFRAMMDAETIRTSGQRPASRRQVAMGILGILDNGDGYQRVEAALRVLVDDGDEWARALLADARVPAA